jgi:hypothetical protein
VGVATFAVAVLVGNAVGALVTVATAANVAVGGGNVAVAGTVVATVPPQAAKPTAAKLPSTPINAARLSFTPIILFLSYNPIPIRSSLSNVLTSYEPHFGRT